MEVVGIFEKKTALDRVLRNLQTNVENDFESSTEPTKVQRRKW
jgi:hypothetical protein